MNEFPRNKTRSKNSDTEDSFIFFIVRAVVFAISLLLVSYCFTAVADEKEDVWEEWRRTITNDLPEKVASEHTTSSYFYTHYLKSKKTQLSFVFVSFEQNDVDEGSIVYITGINAFGW